MAGRHAHVPAWAAGLTAGALTTTTTTNGPPMLLHLLGRGAPPVAVRDTLTVCFLGLSAIGAIALCGHRRRRRCRTPRWCSAWCPASPPGTWSAAACSPVSPPAGSYEGVLTTILVVAAFAGLVGVLF